MSSDEPDLIRHAQRGEAAAFATLYDRHYDAVYRYCYYRVSDVQAAQDLTAQVFVRMVEKLPSYRQNGRPLLAWLYTIARNLVTDHYRREGRATQLPLDESLVAVSGNPVRDADRRLLAECLAKAMGDLTEEQRLVVLMKYLEGYTNAEVAGALSKTEGAIKSLQHRALAALRRTLERERCYEH